MFVKFVEGIGRETRNKKNLLGYLNDLCSYVDPDPGSKLFTFSLSLQNRDLAVRAC